MSEFEGAVAESPTATPTTPEATPQAANQPDTTANGNGRPQHVPYERFQQVNARMREYERQIRELTARQQQPQPTTPQQPLSIEDRIQQEQAAEALEKLIGQHPKLKSLLSIAEHGDKLLQGYQGVQTLSRQQLSNTLKTGNDRVATLAKEAGLPDKPESIGAAQDLVAGLIAKSPDLRDRLFQGDLSVVDETFAVVNGFIEPLRRTNVASLGATKLATSQLPPRGTSSALPGEPAPKPLEPGKEREYRREMHNDARRAIREAMSQG